MTAAITTSELSSVNKTALADRAMCLPARRTRVDLISFLTGDRSIPNPLTVFRSVIGVLAPTHRSLENSTERLVPATRKLDVARASYNATAAVLQQIVDSIRIGP